MTPTAAGVEHLSGYQRRDHEVVDYQMYVLPGAGLQFRGPAPRHLDARAYFSCVGAAQTFGCFVACPFPQLLSDRLGIATLNLGYGGAGPEFFARHPALVEYVNGGAFAIIQVMSGRSQSNSLFDTGGLEYVTRRSDGVRLAAATAYERVLTGPRGVRRVPLVRNLVRRANVPRLRRLVQETRAAWVESYRSLLAQIVVPKILFWFSMRNPEHVDDYRSIPALFGEFPQLVNHEMVAEVRHLCDDYVECVSRRGNPQLLISRFTGQPVTVDPALDRPEFHYPGGWTHNCYYPSAEMHQDAADALFTACKRRMLEGRRP
jgi:Domain of unknown function (DUF6473)